MLGLPAIAVSQQSLAREMDFRLGQRFEFEAAAAFTARVVEEIEDVPLPSGHAAQPQLPRRRDRAASRSRGSASGSTATSWCSRTSSRAAASTGSTATRPSYERQEGTDLAAVADGRVAVTPIHFDLTDEPGIETLQAYDLARHARAGGARARMNAGGAGRGAAPPARVPRPPLLRPRRPRDRRRRLRRAARRAARAGGRAPGAAHARLADPARRRHADLEAREGQPPRSRCSRSPTCARPRSCGRGSRACARTSRARGSRTRDFTYVAEPKIDGLAISLVYRDGVLERGATRGNGEIGEDVTHNLRTIPSIPLRIDDAPPLVEVRGEVYMSLPDFTALNERRASQGLSTFMNPRNSAAGTIRQLDPALAAERPLVDVVLRHRRRPRGCAFASHWEGLEWLRAHGFRVNGDVRRLDERGRGRRAVPRLAGAARRARLRDRRRRREGRRPRAAAAARRRRARPALGGGVEVPAHDRRHDGSTSVHWNVGKFGDLHPFAVLEPVQIRRRDGQARHAAQRGGPRAQGRPLRRRRDRAARRRRDPAGRLARPARGREAGPLAARAAAGALPVVRHADGQGARAASSPAARTSPARTAAGSCSSTSWRRWTSTAWARSRSRTLQDAGLVRDRRRLLPADQGAAARRSTASARCRRRTCCARSRRRASGRSARPVRDRDRGRRRRSPAATSPSTSARSTRCWPRSPEEIAEHAGHRPGRRAADPRPAGRRRRCAS